MKKIKIVIRLVLIPLWILIFIFYLPIWYTQMSWYYFDFSDYSDGYKELLDKIIKTLKL